MLCFFAEQVLSQLDFLRCWKETPTYKSEVYFFPNQPVEKIAKLYLPVLVRFMALEPGIPWSVSSWTR